MRALVPTTRPYRAQSNSGYGDVRVYSAPNAFDACLQALTDMAFAGCREVKVSAPSGEAWVLNRFVPVLEDEIRRALAVGGAVE